MADKIAETYISRGRRFSGSFKDKMPYAHIVWNEHNPDDTIEKYDGYVIHHIDFDSMNDDIENLTKITKGEHTTVHHSGKGNYFYGKKLSGEANGFYGKKHSEETKKKISEVRKASGIAKGKNNPMYGKRFFGKDNPNYGNTGSKNKLFGKKNPKHAEFMKELWKKRKEMVSI